MKITANRAELLAQVKNAAKAAPSGSSVEVLKGILVEADADAFEIVLTCTNYDAVIQCKLPAAVETGGSMVIDAKLFLQMLALLVEEDVTLETHTNMTCTLKSGTAVYCLSVQPGENYPKPEIPFPENAVKVSNIASASKSTVYAAAKAQEKPVMSGVRVEIRNERLRACGCDGTRLMEKHQKADAAGTLRFLIPSHSFQILSSMVTDKDVLDVGIAGNCAVFTKENFLFSARIVPGEYIDVDRMLLSITPEYSATVEAGAMTAALDALSVVTGKDGHVDMVYGDGKIYLFNGSDKGKSNTSVDAEVKTGTPECFRYNLGYLYEALRRMSGKVEIGLSSIGMLLIKTDTETYFQIPIQRTVKASAKPKSKSKQKAA